MQKWHNDYSQAGNLGVVICLELFFCPLGSEIRAVIICTTPIQATMSNSNVFNCPLNPPDALFALAGRYKDDDSAHKVDMSIGAYRTNEAKPWILPVVHKTEELLVNDRSVTHEYLPILGNPEFRKVAAKLILGDKVDLNTVATVQTLSGTGANHMAAVFLRRYTPWGKKSNTIYVSDPTWANHHTIFNYVELDIKKYPYWDAKTKALDFEGMYSTLKNASAGDIVLLHACAHNPTGVDPTREQWEKLASLIKEKELFPFFDCAYQGFASGDLDNDAWAVRMFIDRKIDMLVCQSFAKNMGLYGERTGALHIVLSDATPETKAAIESQLATQSRAEISNPPAFGARIATKILTTPSLFDEWRRDIKTMAERILDMRAELKGELVRLGTPGNWDHLTSQIGMFSFTGLDPKQVGRLVTEFHIYLAANGRISMAGLNKNNVKYVAKSIDTVVRQSSNARL